MSAGIQERPFVITDIDKIRQLIAAQGKLLLEDIADQVVGRPRIRECRWGGPYCSTIQDIYDFLLYLYNNMPECRQDPIGYVSKFVKQRVDLGPVNKIPLLSIRIKIIGGDCESCKGDDDLTRMLFDSRKIESIDDAFVILRGKQYDFMSAVHMVFDSIYPHHNLGKWRGYAVFYAIMCWILVIQQYVTTDVSFRGFLPIKV
jgi:hypothetical protein